jgi:hypothetical protein
MLPPDGQSDRFLATKETKLVGDRRGKFVFCYVPIPNRQLAPKLEHLLRQRHAGDLHFSNS